MSVSSVDCYIVRIYRRNADDGVIGVVELPVREQRVAFRGFQELQAILTRESGTDATVREEPSKR